MTTPALTLARHLTERYCQLPPVEAIAVAGSTAAGTVDAVSDVDLYVYLQRDIPANERLAIAQEFAANAVTNDFWGPGNEWMDPATGRPVDVVFWTVAWIEEQLERILRRQEAWVGYSTCFWHTVNNSRILFDRQNWLSKLQAFAQQPYPERLVTAIIAQNYPILRRNPSAYYHQLEKAVARGDLVSINHRAAAFLASYFDILFAVNRLTHPGEKRLLAYAQQHCAQLPPDFADQVNALLRATALAEATILAGVNALVDGLDELLKAQGDSDLGAQTT